MLIGGMFDIDVTHALTEPVNNQFEFPCDTKGEYVDKVYTNNGRTATVYALKSMSIQGKVLVPEYTCVSVLNALQAVGTEFEMYRIKENFAIDLEDLENKMQRSVQAIYVIHYFGIPQPQSVMERIKNLAEQYHLIVIEDLTQSLLSDIPKRIGIGDMLVASTRKWFPMSDGGVVAFRKGVDRKTVPLASAYDEAVYTQMFLAVARNYYGEAEAYEKYPEIERYANAKRYLDFTPRAMTDISRRIFFQSNIKSLMENRRLNFNYLYDCLSHISQIQIYGGRIEKEDGIIPFGFQMVVPEREELKKYLIAHGVIPEIQWVLPDTYYEPSGYAQYMSEHSLMLQCDQRYGEKEMAVTCHWIQKFYREERSRKNV